MGLHVQQEVVLVLGLLVAHGTLKLRVDAALEPDVSAEAVQTGVRVAAPGARVRLRRADDGRAAARVHQLRSCSRVGRPKQTKTRYEFKIQYR